MKALMEEAVQITSRPKANLMISLSRGILVDLMAKTICQGRRPWLHSFQVVNETVTYLQNGTMVLTQLLFYSNGTSVHRNITEFGTTTSKASPESVPRPSPTEHIEKQPPPETTPIVPNPPGVIFGPKNDSGQSGYTEANCQKFHRRPKFSRDVLEVSLEVLYKDPAHWYAFPTLQQPLKIYECLDTGEWTDNNNGDKCEYVAPRRKNSADL
nr:unnamed protein product [Haemonchus contortus]